MESRAQEVDARPAPLSRVPLWALAGGVIALIAIVLVTIAVIGDETLPDRAGPPIEELAVERTNA